MSLRSPLAAGETLTGGDPEVRVPAVAAEALTGGVPAVRMPLAAPEALTGGTPVVRTPLVAIEVLTIVPPEAPLPGTDIFPDLPGLSWSVTRKPGLAKRVATHQSGREIRTQQMQYPVREFTLTYQLLRAAPAWQELQILEGFWLRQGGPFRQFLFRDRYTPDWQVTGGPIGTGDGGTKQYTLTRTLGGFAEPVGYVFPAGVTAVYLDGVQQAESAWSVGVPNQLVFAAAPPAGAAITADFSFYFQVRFSDETVELEEFMAMLFELQELKLLQVLP